MAQIKSVLKRSGEIVNFTPERITNAIYRAAVSVGGRDRETAENLSQQLIEILQKSTHLESIPTIEEIQDVVEKVLIENGHAKVAKAYILYRDERARRREERASRASNPSVNIPWAKIWHVLDWSIEHNVNTIAGLNQRIAEDEFPQIVAETEEQYHVDVENAVETIARRKGELK
ncbi:MAG: ATP cone domain-containing protein, partial [Anaerolineales bacterium]|nr:ATP cone domain-containing protein [Anaerolineales bacterium]